MQALVSTTGIEDIGGEAAEKMGRAPVGQMDRCAEPHGATGGVMVDDLEGAWTWWR